MACCPPTIHSRSSSARMRASPMVVPRTTAVRGPTRSVACTRASAIAIRAAATAIAEHRPMRCCSALVRWSRASNPLTSPARSRPRGAGSNAVTGEMPLIPASRASKNAVFPSPIELMTPTPVTKTRSSKGTWHLALCSVGEQREVPFLHNSRTCPVLAAK